jgi:predicted RNase H-like HicB family nuclease
MRKIDLTVLIECDEDGIFVAKVPALKGCHTQAQSLDELMTRIKEAAQLCLEVAGKDEIPSLKFEGIHRLEVEI